MIVFKKKDKIDSAIWDCLTREMSAPQFCSAGGIPPAPIRLLYLKWIDHTHSTLPRVNFAHVGACSLDSQE